MARGSAASCSKAWGTALAGISGVWAPAIWSMSSRASASTSLRKRAGSTSATHGQTEKWWNWAMPSAQASSGISSTRSTGPSGMGAQKASEA